MLPSLVALLAFSGLALASPLLVSQGFTVPISKRSSLIDNGVVNKDALKAQVAKVQKKYARTLNNYEANTGSKHPLSDAFFSGLEKRGTASDQLTDNEENLWYGDVAIGTPATTFTIDFDTGSSDLFVPSSSCSGCGSHTKYSPSKSSTSKDLKTSFELEYGDGSTTSGTLYTDTVSIGGLTVRDQTLGAATEYSSSFVDAPSDGLMGLGFESISSYPATPYVFNLLDHDSLTYGQFSFYLADSGSELYLGGADSSKYTGSFHYTDVTLEGYWEVTTQSLKVGSTTVASNENSIVDTGTTLLYVDSQTAKSLYSHISGAKEDSSLGDGIYTIPCNSIPNDITVGFGGMTVTILSATLNFGLVEQGSKTCVAGIAAGDFGFWILGDVFLRNVYTTFDMANARVGVASLA